MRVYMPLALEGGKGEFLRRLTPHLEDLGVGVTDRLTDAYDIELHVARVKGSSGGKRVVRMDGVCHDIRMDWKTYNVPYQEAIASADGVIYQSQYARKMCDHYLGRPACKTAVIFNGADPGFYRGIKTASSPYRYNFVASAIWRSPKRLKDTLLAFLKADIDNSCLWVAGDLSDSQIIASDQTLKDALVQYGLHNKRIEFLGHLDQVSLGSYLRLCDALIHLCSHDACPNSVVEALCAGKMVITNNIGGTPEIVEPSGGMICDVDAPLSMAPFDLCHQPLIDHEPVVAALHEVIRKKNKQVCCGHVDIRNIAVQYKAFLESVLGTSQPIKPRRRKGNMNVAHICRKYLGLTETFIYGYLANAQKHDPLVVTDVMRNTSAFPIACSYLFNESAAGQELVHKYDYPTCFASTIKDAHCDLLHAHFGPVGYQSLRLKRKLGMPLVTTFYGYDASGLLRVPKWQQAFRELFQRGDLFVALGPDMVRRLVAAGCPREKIQIVHLGVDMARIRFRKRRWPKAGEPVKLLYCGRLVEKKGILYALEAFVKLAQTWDNLVFRIVGDGPFRQGIEEMVNTLGLEDRIVLRGALSHGEVLDEMRDAHLFVLPSQTAESGDMEGTPTVLMEAQASGLPVVSTHHADIAEVVIDGQTGFLAPEKDSQALREHLAFLIENPSRWSEMGWEGRCHVEKHYNIETEVRKLEACYHDLLN